MTLPDDLAEAVDQYVQAQEAPPALTTVMQAALREYLRERGIFANSAILEDQAREEEKRSQRCQSES